MSSHPSKTQRVAPVSPKARKGGLKRVTIAAPRGKKDKEDNAIREAVCRKSEAAMLATLNEVTARLGQTQDLLAGLDMMIAATVDLLNADFGSVQLFDRRERVLRLVAHRGFKRDFLEKFREVPLADDTACARAVRGGRRVIIEDVEADTAFASHQSIARAAGYRAVQCTP